MDRDGHLSGERILQHLEGELSQGEATAVREHLEACWRCRAKRGEMEETIADFVRVHQEGLDAALPPAAGPRALLRARMAERAAVDRGLGAWWPVAACLCGLMAAGWWLVGHRRPLPGPVGPRPMVSIPNSRLTPGATVLLSRQAVCSQQNVKNKTVPLALQQLVFEEYGIAKAEPRAYEVDYLVTPALGGADDIHNLWPQPYSAVWNAQVKDALEDRLRDLVCDGSVDLAQAQREIAANWVDAYKKYFHTDIPLEEHKRRNGDRD
jgi:hypothetical protein